MKELLKPLIFLKIVLLAILCFFLFTNTNIAFGSSVEDTYPITEYQFEKTLHSKLPENLVLDTLFTSMTPTEYSYETVFFNFHEALDVKEIHDIKIEYRYCTETSFWGSACTELSEYITIDIDSNDAMNVRPLINTGSWNDMGTHSDDLHAIIGSMSQTNSTQYYFEKEWQYINTAMSLFLNDLEEAPSGQSEEFYDHIYNYYNSNNYNTLFSFLESNKNELMNDPLIHDLSRADSYGNNEDYHAYYDMVDRKLSALGILNYIGSDDVPYPLEKTTGGVHSLSQYTYFRNYYDKIETYQYYYDYKKGLADYDFYFTMPLEETMYNYVISANVILEDEEEPTNIAIESELKDIELETFFERFSNQLKDIGGEIGSNIIDSLFDDFFEDFGLFKILLVIGSLIVLGIIFSVLMPVIQFLRFIFTIIIMASKGIVFLLSLPFMLIKFVFDKVKKE